MKKLFTIVLAMNIASLQTTSKCNLGCLKCTSVKVTATDLKDICEFCDSSKKYYLKDQTCILSDEDNCSVINPLNGQCNQCNQNFYLDQITRKCLQISPDNQIQDCTSYDSLQNCISCVTGKYLSKDSCIPVAQIITNCKINKSNELCQECESNYYLSEDQKTCNELPSQSNCLVYSKYQCKACGQGYILNKNSFEENLKQNLTQNTIEQIYQFMNSNNTNLDKVNNSIKVCQKLTVENCDEHQDFKTCKKCATGYYLNQSKTCTENPQKSIQNCAIYKDEQTCLDCNQGYLLMNSKDCSQIQTSEYIIGCKNYRTDTSRVECIECFDGEFLLGNKCQKRVNNEIENCQTYSIVSDKCQQCASNYVMSADGQLCLQVPSFCKFTKAFSSSITQEELECKECVDGYYANFSTGNCIQGRITDCKTYELNSNECKVCIDKFFLIENDKTCYEHNDLDKCQIYDIDQQNKCDTCQEQYQNLNIKNYCKVYQEIENCLEYTFNNTTSSCSKCNTNYDLVNGKCKVKEDEQDEEAQEVEVCSSYDSCNDQCTSCIEGYGLDNGIDNDKPQCRQAHEYISNNCVNDQYTNEPHDFNEIQCKICKENFFPYKDDYGNVCINQNLLNQVSFIDSTSLIDSCIAYNDQGLCILCQQDKYLSYDQQSCKDNCNDSYIISISYDDDFVNTSPVPSYVYFKNHNKCGESKKDNVLIEAPAIGDESNYEQINIKCKDWITSIKTLDDTQSLHTNVNPEYSNNKQLVEHPLDVYNKVNCPEYNATNYVDGQADINKEDLRENCELFYEADGNDFGCVKCKWGYVGDNDQYKVTNSGVNTLGQCLNMGKCNKDIKYKNINAYWNQFYSCHKCNNDNEIPILSIDTNGIDSTDLIGFVKVNKDVNINSKKDNGQTYRAPLECINVNDKQLLLDGLGYSNNKPEENINLLEGCALGIFNSNYENTNDNNKIFSNKYAYNSNDVDLEQSEIGLLCVSCKPGYRAEWYKNKQNIVRQCIEIENCKSNGTLMNACETCNDGYIYRYDNGIKWDECIKINQDIDNQNGCYAYEQDSETEGKCKVCKKGYYLSKKNICEEIKSPNCNSNKFYSIHQDLKIKQNSKYSLYVYQNGYGCLECNDGFVNFKIDQLYVQNYCIGFKDDIPKVQLIENCKQYNNDIDSTICISCNDNYILNENKLKCIKKETIPNCNKIDNTGQKCKECEEGYTLFNNGLCLEGNISDCMKYYNDEEQTQQICKQCNEGYYLQTGKTQCKPGLINNCSQYEDFNDSKCIKCIDDYWVVNDGKLCLKQFEYMNCPEVKIQNSDNSIQCINTCNNPWEKIVDNTPNDQVTLNDSYIGSNCFEKNIIENCKLIENVLDQSNDNYSFICNECEDDYYLNENNKECILRKIKISLCKEYDLKQDKCNSCQDGSYMKIINGKPECYSNFNDFENCIKYTTNDNGKLQCEECKDNYYFKDQICQQVIEKNKIENCKIYKDELTCQQCQDNYYLIDNLCKLITVQNCSKLINESSCEICNDNYRLVEEDGKFNCEFFEKQNCQKYEQSGNNNCLICNERYYPDQDGNCVVVKSTIQDCQVYQSNNVCKQCNKEYALSSDGSQCILKGSFDSNCIDQVIPSSMECSICNIGYIFKDNTCIFNEALSLLNGCAYLDEDDQTKCLICNSGYYMQNDKKCYLSRQDSNPNDPSNDGTPSEEAFEFKLQSMIFILYFISL